MSTRGLLTLLCALLLGMGLGRATLSPTAAALMAGWRRRRARARADREAPRLRVALTKGPQSLAPQVYQPRESRYRPAVQARAAKLRKVNYARLQRRGRKKR